MMTLPEALEVSDHGERNKQQAELPHSDLS